MTLSTSSTLTNATDARHAIRDHSFDPIDLIANTRPIVTLSEMYSGLMEETVSPRLTLYLISVQVAAFFVIMPAEMPIFTRIACFAWLIASGVLAKQEYCKR